MKKHSFLLTIIAVGVFGRWVLVPSLNRLKERGERQAAEAKKVVVTSCFSVDKCSIEELYSMRFKNSENRPLLRKYILSHWDEISQTHLKQLWYLRAQVINDEDLENSLLKSVKLLNKDLQKSFLRGLFLCHHRACTSFSKKNINAWDKTIYFEEVNSLQIKLPGSWSKKNKYLVALLTSYSKSAEFTKAVALIDYIPNHPKLKKFIESNYLKIIGQRNIEKVTYHLARYNSGWHDRSYKSVLESREGAHIDSFIRNMKVGCPQKLDLIFSYWSGWSNATRSFAKLEAKYLFGKVTKQTKMMGLTVKDFVEESKCTNSTNSFSSQAPSF